MDATVWPPPRSLMPSSQTTWVRPESPSTSRLSRSVAAWPEVAGKTTGLTTLLPPIASLTTSVAIGVVQPARQHVRPAVVDVERGVRAIGDRIVKGADHDSVGGRHDVGCVDEEP